VTTYQVQCKVIFMLNGSTREQVVLEHGDIVQGATLGSVSARDLREYTRMEQQHSIFHRNERIVWVQVYGAVRGLIVGKQCVPSNLTATVPL
jgi:hypothetical protein